MITGKTMVYGLIGNPVGQSFSPFIHNRLADEMGIDMTYVTFPVDHGQVANAYTGMLALGIQGMNVTVPYKQEIMTCIDAIDEEAQTIGAVNTLVHTDQGIKGYNTDWLGLRQSLYNRDIQLNGKSVVILGAGGAARATAVMCAKEGVASLIIANRTLAKAKVIGDLIRDKYDILARAMTIDDLTSVSHVDMIFQTTPIGMYPKERVTPLDNRPLLRKVDVAVDLIYNPGETLFLSQARAEGCQVVNGLEMLFYQAVKAFELWHDLEVPKSIQDRSLAAFKEALKAKQ